MRCLTTVIALRIGGSSTFRTGAWGKLALYFDGLGNNTLRTLLASAYAIVRLAALERVVANDFEFRIR